MDTFKIKGQLLSSIKKEFKGKSGDTITYYLASFLTENGAVAEFKTTEEVFKETKEIKNQEGVATFELSTYKMEPSIKLSAFDWN